MFSTSSRYFSSDALISCSARLRSVMSRATMETAGLPSKVMSFKLKSISILDPSLRTTTVS